MPPLTKVVALGSSGLAAASVATWLVAGGNNPPLSDGHRANPRPTVGQPSGGDANVCVDQDSVLRIAPSSGVCPDGSTPFTLAQADVDKIEPEKADDPFDSTAPSKDAKSEALADIERRISALEKAPLFEVVDSEGRLIFSVAPDRVQLYRKDKTPVAGMLAFPKGGEFVARSTDNRSVMFMGAVGERAGLRLSEGGLPRIELLKQQAGNYAFRIPLGVGVAAGIGESQARSGALVVGDRLGRTRVSLVIVDGKGAATVFDDRGSPAASLTESEKGGGLLVLADANRNAMVKMGVNGNRYGVVMTFPPGFPFVPRSGLPGSYFLGCAGGGSCVP